jgi:protein-tyrosine phosphatase
MHRFEQLHNFRDIGGCETLDGRRLRTGVLFRCAELHRASARDLAQLRELGIKLICDLRSPDESERKQPRKWWSPAPRLINVPLHDPAIHDGQRRKILGFLWGTAGVARFQAFCRLYYQHLAFERAARIGEVLTLLASAENQPALIHCAAGKDRTGVIAAFVQLLLGVPFATVRTEYLRTNEDIGPRLERLLATLRLTKLSPPLSARMRLIMTTHPEYLVEIHERIVATHGSFEQYVGQECRLNRETIEQLRRRLLE